MNPKKSTPSNPPAGRRQLDSIDSLRPSSLPPELGSIDMSWDDDPRSMSGLGLLPDSDLDIDIDENERTTAVPEIPMAELVAASMAEAEKKEKERGQTSEPSNWKATPHAPQGATNQRPSKPPVVGLPSIEPPPVAQQVLTERRSPREGLVEHELSQDEAPTADYRAKQAAGNRNTPAATQPAPAPQQDNFGAPFKSPPEGPTASHRSISQRPDAPLGRNEAGSGGPAAAPLSGRGFQSGPPSAPPRSRFSSAPPLTSRSMAGPVGPPSSSRTPILRDGQFSEAPPTTRTEADAMRQRMKDRYATGDFSGAYEIAEAILSADDGDLEAQRFSTSCRDVLTQMVLSRIGELDQLVEVSLSPEEMRWLTLDHRAGFLLSLVDGALSVEELLDIAGMPKLESLRILVNLIEQRVVRLVPP